MPYIPMRPQQFISMIDLFLFFLIKHVLARVCILLEQDIFVNIPFYLFSYENTWTEHTGDVSQVLDHHPRLWPSGGVMVGPPLRRWPTITPLGQRLECLPRMQ